MDSAYSLGAVAMFIVLAVIYFIPTFVVKKSHPNQAGVILLNIFLGWTFLGWVGALIWAISGNDKPRNITYHCTHCQYETKIQTEFCPVCGKNRAGNTLEDLKILADLKFKRQQEAKSSEKNVD